MSRLIARHEELQELTRAVARAQEREGALILLCGEPGVGKSSLLKELRRWALARARPIAQGKFDQYKQGRPYAALFSAFDSAIESALANEEARYQSYRARFAAANRALLAVLGPDFPQLHHIAGSLPTAQRLGPSENDHRFKRAFRHLLECLSDPVRPLILILDDLQWADAATVELLLDWYKTGLPTGVALVCSCRVGEARMQPAALKFLEATPNATRVLVSPLDFAGTCELCASLLPQADALSEISSAVHRQSRGNPLHAIELLKSMLAHGPHAGSNGRAQLQVDGVRLVDASDAVLELLAARIRELEPLTQRVLVAAACVGAEFGSGVLSIALDDAAGRIALALTEATAEGVLVRSSEGGDRYAFCHDRAQQAAYALGSEDSKSAIHIRLGKHYLKGANANRECLFGAIEHLNAVRAALSTPERTELGELNLKAAFLAKESIAYERAISLFRAFELDQETASLEDRFAAALALAECVFLTSTLEVAEGALSKALQAAPSPERERAVMQTWQEICQHQQRYKAAIRILLVALRQVGHPMPENPTVARVLFGLGRVLLKTRKLDLKSVAERQDTATPGQRTILELLLMLWGPSLWVNQNLNGLVVIHLMQLTLEVGNAPGTAMAYVCYAVLEHVLFKNHERALEFAQLGLSQLDRQSNEFVATRVRFLALTFFGAFERGPRQNVEGYEAALTDCIARGEFLASHLLDGIITTLPTHGYALPVVIEQLDRYQHRARQVNAESTLELIWVVRQWATALAQGDTEPLERAKVTFPACIGLRDLLAMMLAYLWREDSLVASLAQRVRKDVVVHANPLHRCMYCLFMVLAQLRARGRLDKTGRGALKTLLRFAQIHPGNFRAPSCLALAEVARAEGRSSDAVDLYRKAVSDAAANDQQLYNALSLERLGSHYESLGEQQTRDSCLFAAVASYRQFGAHAKARQLQRTYSEIEWPNADGGARSEYAIDRRLEAMMTAAFTIAEETSSEKLAPTLVRVVAKAANAERALLLQRLSDDWSVVAGWQLNVGEQQTPLRLDQCESLSQAIVRYVTRTNTVLRIVGTDERFADDQYLSQAELRSVLCVPISHRGDVSAMLYLENSFDTEGFSHDQTRLVELLGRQAAIALANSETQRLQIESVQARVNPHFLHNALSVIAELIATEPAKAESVVLQLSRLYRTMLKSSADRMVTIEQELELVRDYLELERARFGNKLSVQWAVKDELTMAQIPSLLLQPLVENAVHHGIRRKIGNGTVNISVDQEGQSLVLGVSDDGPGWYTSVGGNGFGLRSVEKRLRLLYGANAQLSISHSPGVSVRIHIPLG